MPAYQFLYFYGSPLCLCDSVHGKGLRDLSQRSFIVPTARTNLPTATYFWLSWTNFNLEHWGWAMKPWWDIPGPFQAFYNLSFPESNRHPSTSQGGEITKSYPRGKLWVGFFGWEQEGSGAVVPTYYLRVRIYFFHCLIQAIAFVFALLK